MAGQCRQRGQEADDHRNDRGGREKVSLTGAAKEQRGYHQYGQRDQRMTEETRRDHVGIVTELESAVAGVVDPHHRMVAGAQFGSGLRHGAASRQSRDVAG